MEKYLGRNVIEKQEFTVNGTFEGLYAAERWLHSKGYNEGSLCRDMPVALVKGDYNLPQKWKNFDNEDMKNIDGVMISNDFRDDTVTVYFFEKLPFKSN